MRVRLNTERHRTQPLQHTELRVGQLYKVLCVEYEDFRVDPIPGGKIGPVLYSWELFDIVDPSISNNWIFDVDLCDGSIYLGPPEFKVPGFWERVHDGHSDAIALYQAIAAAD